MLQFQFSMAAEDKIVEALAAQASYQGRSR
jgi:hypothetical protein